MDTNNNLTLGQFKSQLDHKRGLASRPVMEHTAGPGGNSPGNPPIPAGAGQNTLSLPDSSYSQEDFRKCATRAVLSQCSSGDHSFAKRLYCGREDCPICGRDGSPAHYARISPVIPKIQQIGSMVYMVIEFPNKYRTIGRHSAKAFMSGSDLFNDPVDENGCVIGKKGAVFNKTYNIILDVLTGRRCGRKGRVGGFFERTISRWHWANDYVGLIDGRLWCFDQAENKKITPALNALVIEFKKLGGRYLVVNIKSNTLFYRPINGSNNIAGNALVKHFAKHHRLTIKNYSSIEFNPHLNILADGGYIEPERLQLIKEKLAKALGVDMVIVNTKFYEEQGQKFQKLKYSFRATFIDKEWSHYWDEKIRGIHNTRYRGDWKRPEVWHLEPGVDQDYDSCSKVVSLAHCQCPICNQPLKKLGQYAGHDDKHGNWTPGQAMYWSLPFDARSLTAWNAKEIGNTGYYIVNNRQNFTGVSQTPDEIIRWSEISYKNAQDRRVKRDDYGVFVRDWLVDMDAKGLAKDIEEVNYDYFENGGQESPHKSLADNIYHGWLIEELMPGETESLN